MIIRKYKLIGLLSRSLPNSLYYELIHYYVHVNTATKGEYSQTASTDELTPHLMPRCCLCVCSKWQGSLLHPEFLAFSGKQPRHASVGTEKANVNTTQYQMSQLMDTWTHARTKDTGKTWSDYRCISILTRWFQFKHYLSTFCFLAPWAWLQSAVVWAVAIDPVQILNE